MNAKIDGKIAVFLILVASYFIFQARTADSPNRVKFCAGLEGEARDKCQGF